MIVLQKARGGNKVILNLHQHTAFTITSFTRSRQANASLGALATNIAPAVLSWMFLMESVIEYFLFERE
jgi:hypothetical protein